MARIDYQTCDPFRAWNRLEARPRKPEFDKVLAASVHDPLWFITRQWQFGEFQAEDTGSAIFAKTQMMVSQLTKYKNANGSPQNFAGEYPLESKVENMPFRLHDGHRADAAFMLIKCLDGKAEELGVTGYSSSVIKQRLQQLYPLDIPVDVSTASSHEEILEGVRLRANEAGQKYRQCFGKRYFDGFKAFEAIVTDKPVAVVEITGGNTSFTSFVNQAVDIFTQWFAEAFGLNLPSSDNAWIPERLEYSFDCAFPGHGAGREVLSAEEYASGNLDWYSFDVNQRSDKPLKGSYSSQEALKKSNILLTVIPTEAGFAGAPNSRWWQFEDGKVDLGNIHAQTTDITKLIFSEYALLYSNDWLLVPYRVPVGAVCETKGIVVTDVFGEQSFIAPAVQGTHDTWSGWGMFNMSTLRDVSDKNLPTDTRLFLAPALPRSMESEPIEEIHLFRDEMTNLVWAVEVTLPDGTGGKMDASRVARKYTELLAGLESVEKPMDVPDENAMFRYVLGNTVPENWIPFIPVHQPGNQRSIRLQRASMPRLFNNEFTRVRPLSQILRVGLLDNDTQSDPYFLHEEEVPRSGIRVMGTFQRGRWSDGAVMEWYGLKKQTGRGEGSSGLCYDRLETVIKPS